MSKLETKKLSPEYYTKEWERNVYPFYVYIFTRQWRYNKFFKPVYTLFALENKKINCYIEIASLKQVAEDILLKVEESDFFINNFKSYVYKTGTELHNFCNKLEKIDLNKKNIKELQEFLAQSFEIYNHHTSGVGVIRNVNRLMQKKLLDLYQSEEIVSTLFSTNKKSFFLKEYEQLLEIVDLIKKKKLKQNEIDKLLDKHTKKYFYLPFGYYGHDIFTKNDFRKKLEDIISKKKESINDLQNKLNIEKQKRNNLILKIKPNIQTKRLIKFGSTCTFFKDFIRGNLNRLHYNIYRLFKELEKKTKINLAELASILPDKNGFVDIKKGKIISGQAIIYSDKDGIQAITNKKAEQLVKIIDKNFKAKYTDTIKGMSASPGLVKGRVKIVFKLEKISQKGFILVTPMTTPDLMPLMKKAKAIITDEGGLTCHAAIVSRELGIPCIVGTGNATKVLKDGDLVEVDANKGL